MSSYTQVIPRPSEKCHRSNNANCRDRISNLPEGVLGHILSCLPIKDALRTCVLSKDWEFKWTLIYDVDISMCKPNVKANERRSFFNIVERMLCHLQSVQKLCISCNYPGVGRLMPLISSILRRNIEDLELRLCHCYILPRSLLNCSTLRNLHLEFSKFKVPIRTCFLSLKRLHLCSVDIVNNNSTTDTILFTLPLLETLELVTCRWSGVKFVEIDAPSLTTFSSTSELEWDERQHYYSIKVIGATLAQLIADFNYPENIILTGSTAVCADLTCFRTNDFVLFQEYGLQVRKLLRELSDVKCLVINHSLPVIGQTNLGLPLARFNQLEELYLVSNGEVEPQFDFNAEGILELLHAAPFLRFLSVAMDEDDFDYKSVASIPSCLVNHLEEVVVDYRRGIEPTYGLEKFLLKNGERLKTMYVSGWKEIIEELSTFPKASACLTIAASK